MLTRWIDALHTIRARFIAAFSSVVRHVKRREATTASRAVHAPGFANVAAPAAVHLAYANWLNDGLRLRTPQAISNETSHTEKIQQEKLNGATHQRTPLRCSLPAQRPLQSLQQVGQTGQIGATAPATLPLPTQVTPASAPAALAASDMLCEDADLADLADLPTSLNDVDRLTEAQRRLVFLRYLVRQRVYNEGFSVCQTPDQYLPHDPHDHSEPHPQSDWN